MIKDEYMKVPELYSVDQSRVTQEESDPGTQAQIPQGRIPFMWAQSLWVIGKLLKEKFIAPGELDPTNRRLPFDENRPEVIVQVFILELDANIKKISDLWYLFKN